jgi:hypothetical protein
MTDSEKMDELLRLARDNHWLNGWTVDLLLAVTAVLVLLIVIIVYVIVRGRQARRRMEMMEARDQQRWAEHIKITERSFAIAGDYQNMVEKWGSLYAKSAATAAQAAVNAERKADMTHQAVADIKDAMTQARTPPEVRE